MDRHDINCLMLLTIGLLINNHLLYVSLVTVPSFIVKGQKAKNKKNKRETEKESEEGMNLILIAWNHCCNGQQIFARGVHNVDIT